MQNVERAITKKPGIQTAPPQRPKLGYHGRRDCSTARRTKEKGTPGWWLGLIGPTHICLAFVECAFKVVNLERWWYGWRGVVRQKAPKTKKAQTRPQAVQLEVAQMG